MLAAEFATVLSNRSAGAAATPCRNKASRKICVDPPPAVQVPRTTPIRSSPSGGIDCPASSIASFVAATAYTAVLSMRRIFIGATQGDGSKPAIAAPSRERQSVVSNP